MLSLVFWFFSSCFSFRWAQNWANNTSKTGEKKTIAPPKIQGSSRQLSDFFETFVLGKVYTPQVLGGAALVDNSAPAVHKIQGP